MLNRIVSLIFAGLLLAGLYAAPALAQDRAKEIRTLLEQRDREVKALLGDKKTLSAQEREQLRDVINDVINFEAMSKAALGPHWDTITPQQRNEFVKVFSDIVRNQSLSDLDIYRAEVSYGEITVNGNTARAITEATYDEKPVKVEYILGFNDGKWRVHDIILDDVSTAEGYARSFQSVIRKRGFDALMTSLRKKRDEVAAKS